jgi:RHS repeat-associated protein
VYGLGLIGREDGVTGQYQSYHSDIRGSTTFLTDEQGKISDSYSYGYYGEVLAHEGSTHQPFQYNGRDGVMHDANGLYYMRARYYHPELKRFLNRDVLKGDMLEGQTLNRYAYVNGDPVSYVDPLGLEKQMVKSSSVGSGNLNTIVHDMDASEAARYQRYWEQDINLNYKGSPNTRERTYTTPGTRSIIDQKLSNTGELYKRETIYDQFGRRIGNNDYTNHEKPHHHESPHHHPNPWQNPTQHGPNTPGLHPNTPRW